MPLITTSAQQFAPDSPTVAAALAALSKLPAPEPVPAVSMVAGERLLIIGDAEVAVGWAERLAGQREVIVLAREAFFELPDDAGFTLLTGCEPVLSGHLGAFEANWLQEGEKRQVVGDVVLGLAEFGDDRLRRRAARPRRPADAGAAAAHVESAVS